MDAQLEYHTATDVDGDGVRPYAARFWSGEGKRDGLYWPTTKGEPDNPMGTPAAEAVDNGYRFGESEEGPRPYHGYYFTILTAQGAGASSGAKSYLRDGRLTDGVGLLAWPASQGNSGIMSFQVNQRVVVYQADLGEDIGVVASAIEAYDPSDGWQAVVD